MAGVKRALARVVEGGSSLLFAFSKRTHRAKSDRYSKICKYTRYESNDVGRFWIGTYQ
jgi:hypothetical protein